MSAIDPRYVEMIHRDLDGELSDFEKGELEAFLARTPTARSLQESFVTMNSMFDRVVELEPPSGLRESVIASIAQPRVQPVKAVRAGWFGWIRQAFAGPGPMVRYGAMAAILLVAAVSFTWFEPGSGRMDQIEAAGTMAPPAEPRRILVESAEVQGTILARRTATGVSFDLDLVSTSRVETAVEVESDLVFSAYDVRTGSASLIRSGGGVVIEGEGRHSYSVAFETQRNLDSTVFFDFIVDGSAVRRVEVDFGAAR